MYSNRKIWGAINIYTYNTTMETGHQDVFMPFTYLTNKVFNQTFYAFSKCSRVLALSNVVSLCSLMKIEDVLFRI